MKKRFSEEQIIGFLREAESGLPVAELCRRHGFSEVSWRTTDWLALLEAMKPGTIGAEMLEMEMPA